jgi:hypothetical protein
VFPLPIDLVKPLLDVVKPAETPQAELNKGNGTTTPLLGEAREREPQGR